MEPPLAPPGAATPTKQHGSEPPAKGPWGRLTLGAQLVVGVVLILAAILAFFFARGVVVGLFDGAMRFLGSLIPH